VACIYAQLGEKEEALAWAGRAARNGFPSYPVYEQDPFLEPIRDAIGFRGLVDELRDECRGYAEVYGELAAARRRDSCPA